MRVPVHNAKTNILVHVIDTNYPKNNRICLEQQASQFQFHLFTQTNVMLVHEVQCMN